MGLRGSPGTGSRGQRQCVWKESELHTVRASATGGQSSVTGKMGNSGTDGDFREEEPPLSFWPRRPRVLGALTGLPASLEKKKYVHSVQGNWKHWGKQSIYRYFKIYI